MLLSPTTAKTAPRIDAVLQSPAIVVKMQHAAELAPQEQQDLIWDLFEPSLEYSPFTQQAKGREDQLLRIGYWFEQQGLLKMLPASLKEKI